VHGSLVGSGHCVWNVSSLIQCSYVGHFILTNSLLPLLKTAAEAPCADVRVVTVSSGAHSVFLPPDYAIDFNKPDFLQGKLPYEPLKYRLTLKNMLKIDGLRYAMAKLACTVFAQELQRHFDQQSLAITSISLDPGNVKSDNAVGIWSGLVQPMMRLTMLDQDTGSLTSVFAAAAPEIRRQPQKFKGKYIGPIGVVTPAHPIVKDQKQCSAFWDTTTREVNRYLTEHGHKALNSW
jgi:NAD(P)-dependent dehydrogenase (short-subunit alcohol dehydrogenase family)